MDLTKILKKGDKVYCTVYGYVNVVTVNKSSITVEKGASGLIVSSNGQYSKGGECLLFPSKENRDWSTWKTKKECPFKPYDKVLVKDTYSGIWCADIFSHFDDGTFNCIGSIRSKCIPYNKETQHLVGTNQDCPEKYKIW